MENKLKLEQIAPYLPYGLKGNYEVSEVVPSAKFELRNKELRTDNIDFFLNYAKPILHPLSDIIKHCEDLGFVPMIELLETVAGGYYTEDSVLIKQEFGKFIISNSIEKLIFDSEKRYFNYSVLDNEGEDFKPSFDILYLFQKLFEWHFDVFGLIEKNFAIDINTLKDGK